MDKQIAKGLLAATLALLFVLAGCASTPASSSVPPVSSAPAEGGDADMAETDVLLWADFSAGASNGAELGLVQTYEATVEGEVTVEKLADALSELSGLDFFLDSAHISPDVAQVDWSAASTLVAGLDDREQKEDFHFLDVDSLNWFMMDSLRATILENLDVSEVYYSVNGGDPLTFSEGMFDVRELPVDIPYEGSPFFYAHYNVAGDFTHIDEENSLVMHYPSDFEPEGSMGSDGIMTFPSYHTPEEGPTLLYWVIPNTYDEDVSAFMDHANASEMVGDPGSGVVKAFGTDLDQETGEETPYAAYWMVAPDRIVCIQISCQSEDESYDWYVRLQDGAITLQTFEDYYYEMEDPTDFVTNEDAFNTLMDTLGDGYLGDRTLVAGDEDEVDGMHCWTFSLGTMTGAKFTAEEHFAVADDGSVYIMDVVGGGEYVPYTGR